MSWNHIRKECNGVSGLLKFAKRSNKNIFKTNQKDIHVRYLLITVSQEIEFFKKQTPCESSVRCEKKPRQTRSSEIRYYRCYQI